MQRSLCAFMFPAACAALLLGAAPAVPAQIVGGEWSTHYTFAGEAPSDKFGYSVAAAGDVTGDGIPDLLMGTPYCDAGGRQDAGLVLLCSGADGAVVYRFEGAAPGDQLGYCVASAGDVDGDGVPDLILGAPYAKSGLVVGAGLAYIHSGATGALIRVLPGDERYGLFGFAVNTAGDLGGDGHSEVIVGEPWAQPNGLYRGGSVQVYDGATGALVYQWDSPMESWYFGNAVAPAGDLDGDGTPDLLVGATFADVYAGFHDNAGLVVAYSGATGLELWHMRGRDPMDMLGNAVCGIGDVDQDGLDDVAAGAYLVMVNNKPGCGATYILSGTGALIRRHEGRRTWDRNGWSLANVGDIDGDGINDILSGAYSADTDTGVPDGGKVYLYSGRTGETLHVFQGDAYMDRMGFSVAGPGDLDGDGIPEMMMSAHLAEVAGLQDAGKVYVRSFKTCIGATGSAISSAAGGTVDVLLDFPASEANASYAVLASNTGTGPTTLGGVEIPLTPDALFQRMRFNNPPPFMQNCYGQLGGNGDATASVVCPPGGMQPLIGTTLFVAGVSYLPPSNVRMSTTALPIQILP